MHGAKMCCDGVDRGLKANETPTNDQQQVVWVERACSRNWLEDQEAIDGDSVIVPVDFFKL